MESRTCLSDVPVAALPPGRLSDVLAAEGQARFARTIARGRELLGDSTLWTVNSTASGGGVAEMLRSLIGYVRGDVVLLHDPQTAGMVGPLAAAGVPVIWRAHIGLDAPNDVTREAWRFLIPYVEAADAYVFSRPTYAWEGLDRAKVSIIAPSIDAFAPKNQAMGFTAVTAVLRAAGLAADCHHRSRAAFERLDGTAGLVQRAARMVEDEPLR